MVRDYQKVKIIYNPKELNVLGDNAEVIYVCNECSHEVEIFNDDLLLSWQMHVQEQFHIDTIFHLNEQILNMWHEKSMEKLRTREKYSKQERKHRRMESKNKIVENNANDEVENEKVESDSGELDERKEKEAESLNKNDDAITKVNKKDVKNLALVENNNYVNLSIQKWRFKNDVMNMTMLFPSVELLNNWGYELEVKAKKQMLKTLRIQLIVDSLTEAIKCVYDDYFQIRLFGSRITGLAVEEDNDLDIVIDTDRKLNTARKQLKFLEKLSKIMNNNESGGKWQKTRKIFTARAPIIKVNFAPCNISCDISVENSLAVANSQLFKVLFDHIPIFRQLILLLRFWRDNCEFHKRFINYSLATLALFYFQSEQILPSICDLHKLAASTNQLQHIDGWSYTDYSKLAIINKVRVGEEGMSLVEHLYKFFKFYSAFNFDEDVVCPFLGRPIKKKCFQYWTNQMPTVMNDYKQYMIQNGNNEEAAFDYTSAMCVQDAIELNHNLTKAVPQYDVDKFRLLCELSQFAIGKLIY